MHKILTVYGYWKLVISNINLIQRRVEIGKANPIRCCTVVRAAMSGVADPETGVQISHRAPPYPAVAASSLPASTRCIQPVHYSLITEDSISASTMQSQADNKIKVNSMTTSRIDHSLNIKGPRALPQNPIAPSSKHARDHSRISILESCR